MKLWQGRLSGSLDETAARLNNSLDVDQRLALVDIQGSLAWANALRDAGVLTAHDTARIVDGLLEIQAEFAADAFVFLPGDEDIHTAIERRLTERIGPVGGKLHTGRSRNDQVATDFRLWMLSALDELGLAMGDLQRTLVARAEKDAAVIIPGYTHLQRAQPVLLSHWWLSHFWALDRDRQRLADLRQRTAQSPLGCGALAGSGFPIDRFALAVSLGFDAPAANSLDAVSDRDFAAEFLFACALAGVHLSRLAEALILFATREFGFITLDDAFSTGSSLMPQKKNPDPLELVRGMAGELTGRLFGLLMTLKALPSAYDKDLQGDKAPVFECFDRLTLVLPVLGGAIASLTVHADKTLVAISADMLATDLADMLVEKGVPFRQAYAAVGQAVRRAEEHGETLPELSLEVWQEIHPAFDATLFQAFDPVRAVSRRAAWGGTAPEAVAKQLALAKQMLEQKT